MKKIISIFVAGFVVVSSFTFANATGAQCVTAMGATTGIKSFGETEEFIKNKTTREL